MPPTQSSEVTTSFGARMRHERERRKISIESIAESTKILGALLEGLERDDVSRWPLGLYRRAFFRSYAAAIGLDPETTLREFLARFPEPEPSPLPVDPPRDGTRLRLTLAEGVSWFTGGPLLVRMPRCQAAAFDAVVIGSAGISLFVALGVFWAPLGVAGACYYLGGILLLGNSPGVCLFAPRPQTALKREATEDTEDEATEDTENTEDRKFSDRAPHRHDATQPHERPTLANVMTGR